MSIADDFQTFLDEHAATLDTATTDETPQERRQRLANEFAAAIEPRFTQHHHDDTTTIESELF